MQVRKRATRAVASGSGRFYLGTEEGVVALDFAGSLLWKRPIGPVDASLALSPKGSVIANAGGVLHRITADGAVTRYEARRALL